MAVPTWVTGQVLAASDINSWFVPVPAYKTADLGRASTITLTADPDLSLPLAASSVYLITISLSFANANATAGGVNFSFAFTVPSGATGYVSKTYWISASSQQTALPDPWTTQRTPYVDNTRDWGMLATGSIFTSSSGNLVLTWAQGTSNATSTFLRKGSIMTALKVG